MKDLNLIDVKNISAGTQKCKGITSTMCVCSVSNPNCQNNAKVVHINGATYKYYRYSNSIESSDIKDLAKTYNCNPGDYFYFELSGTTSGKTGVIGNGTSASDYNYVSCIG